MSLVAGAQRETISEEQLGGHTLKSIVLPWPSSSMSWQWQSIWFSIYAHHLVPQSWPNKLDPLNCILTKWQVIPNHLSCPMFNIHNSHFSYQVTHIHMWTCSCLHHPLHAEWGQTGMILEDPWPDVPSVFKRAAVQELSLDQAQVWWPILLASFGGIKD